MLYIICLIWIVISIVIISILIERKKLIKGSKVHTWVIYSSLVLPSVMMIEYYLYEHTQTLIDFGICTIGECVVFGMIGLFEHLAKKVDWIEYLLAIVILMIYGLSIALNHYMLEGLERTSVIIMGVLLIINLYRSAKKQLKFKLVLAIFSVLICLIIDYNIDDRLKLDTKIARTVIEYAMEEGISTSNDVDIIIYDANKGEENTVLLFHDRVSEKGFKNTTRLIYDDGEVRLIND